MTAALGRWSFGRDRVPQLEAAVVKLQPDGQPAVEGPVFKFTKPKSDRATKRMSIDLEHDFSKDFIVNFMRRVREGEEAQEQQQQPGQGQGGDEGRRAQAQFGSAAGAAAGPSSLRGSAASGQGVEAESPVSEQDGDGAGSEEESDSGESEGDSQVARDAAGMLTRGNLGHKVTVFLGDDPNIRLRLSLEGKAGVILVPSH